MKKAIKLNILNFVFTRHPDPEEEAASGASSLSPCLPLSEKPHLRCHCLPNDHEGLTTQPLALLLRPFPTHTEAGGVQYRSNDMVSRLHDAVPSQHRFNESRQTLLHLSCLWSFSVPLEPPALSVCSSLAPFTSELLASPWSSSLAAPPSWGGAASRLLNTGSSGWIEAPILEIEIGSDTFYHN